MAVQPPDPSHFISHAEFKDGGNVRVTANKTLHHVLNSAACQTRIQDISYLTNMSETFSCYVQVVVFGLPWRAVPSVSAQPGCAAAPQCWSSRPHCGRQPYTPRGAPFWSRGRPAWWFPDMRPSDSETESPALPGWRASWRTASDLVRGRVDSICFTDIDFYIYMAAGRRATAENNSRCDCHQSQEVDKVGGSSGSDFPSKKCMHFFKHFQGT